MIVEIKLHTVSESNSHEHWRARQKRAKEQRAVVALALRAWVDSLPALPCIVEIVRVSPRGLDDDNLRGATKHVRDGIADVLGVDDRDARVEWRYAQAKGPAKYYAVRVSIEPATLHACAVDMRAS